MEFIRLGFLYAHLVACCVAIGLILTSDLKLLKQVLLKTGPSPDEAAHLDFLKYAVSHALVILWVSGLAIIALDASVKGPVYFENPKLQAKIGVVLLLTLNGFLLHSTVLPAVQKAGSVLRLTGNTQAIAILVGAISAVSWFYAAFLGIGRPLNWNYSLTQILGAYPVLIAGGFASMYCAVKWSTQTVYSADSAFSYRRLANDGRLFARTLFSAGANVGQANAPRLA